MSARQTLPNLWLLSDQRNDAKLEEALAALVPGSALVFRHYHLAGAARRERFNRLGLLCRQAGHLLVLSGDSDTALEWGADGVYGPADRLPPRDGLLRFATAHDQTELSRAEDVGVDAIFLSPVFPSRSHPAGPSLGKSNFLAIAENARAPVIALGGMNAGRAAELGWKRWGAIDGLS